MNWQDVVGEFGQYPEKPMAEEIVRLREKFASAKNMGCDATCLNYGPDAQDQLAHSESKRAKLRETLRIIGLAHEMKRGELQRTAICEMIGKALAADAAEDKL